MEVRHLIWPEYNLMGNPLWFIVESIIAGTPLAAIGMVVSRLFPLKSAFRAGPLIVSAVNILLLVNAFLYLAAVIVQFLLDYYNGGEYEQYIFVNRFTGDYWFSPLILIGLRFVLLPQIFWFKKYAWGCGIPRWL